MPEETPREEQSGDDGPRSRSDESTGTCFLKAQNAVRFILEDLELLLGHNSITVMTRKSKLIGSIKADLEFLNYFLEGLPPSLRHNVTVSNLVLEISDALEVLLTAIDSYISNNIVKINFTSLKSTGNFLQHYSKVASLVRKIKVVKRKTTGAEVSSNRGGESFSENSSTQNYSSFLEGDTTMVGFDAEVIELLDKLTGGTKQREVISIVGMGGIGKTTLARRLYSDPVISYYFHVRAWTCVSEFYQLSNLLCNLLCCIVHENDPILSSSCDATRGEKLYKSLKGRRYLIVIDDVWTIFAWKDLEKFFPKDNYGSRILVTSRSKDAAMQISPYKPPHLLRFLNPYESWDLFKQKLLLPPENTVPEELVHLGKTIVGHCKGLPHAIVAIAGILSKKEKTEKHWREFEKNIRSCTGIKLMELVLKCLELSYKHLLLPLQSCFLYIGTFPENYEIPVKRLIWSWIGEGFVEHIPGKRLEDVAEDYLKALIDKSLVIVVKKSSDGGTKSCQIHASLRDLCLVKAKEKGFLWPICDCHAWKDSCCSETEPVIAADPFSTCRKSFHSYHSAFYAPADEVFTSKAISIYRLLRRLELGTTFLNFPVEILHLLHLRYLALRFDCIGHPFPTAIFELRYLETCIFDVDKRGRMELPKNIWKMVQLRHLCISQEMILNDPPIDYGSTTILENLQTISNLFPSGSVSDVLARTPNVRNLGFFMTLSHSSRKPFLFPYLAHLHLLEKLKFEYQTLSMVRCSIGHQNKFPPHLKKLTLIGSHVPWEEMSIVSLLPYLEILKIEDNFFSGPLWETNDDGFRRLRYLKLSHMDLHRWISSSDHFPRLEHLVINGCLELEEIPIEIGDIHTLQTIKVYCSSVTSMESVSLILKYQKMLGNDDLEVFLYHHLKEL